MYGSELGDLKSPDGPEDEIDSLIWQIGVSIDCNKGHALTFNHKNAHMYTTWRWVALRVPEGVGQLLWEEECIRRWSEAKHIPGALPHDPIHPPPGRMNRGVRRMLGLLASNAKFLERSPGGEIVHRARVIHPRFESQEQLDVILIDLWKRGTHLETYRELVFDGALEIRDLLDDAPLVYSGVPHLTPPGFQTVVGLREALRSRPPSRNKEHGS